MTANRQMTLNHKRRNRKKDKTKLKHLFEKKKKKFGSETSSYFVVSALCPNLMRWQGV
jgi:hypothetical protein